MPQQGIWGNLKYPYLLLIFFLFFCETVDALANPVREDYLQELVSSAEEKQLYRESYWKVLLHSKSKGKGFESFIDDPRFFLSTDGRKNPKAELIATLKGFFEDPKLENAHPRCRFVARYEWLKRELAIDETRLPSVNCSEFDEVMRRMSPKSAALIFPTAYMNSPASMFGHTLLRIDGTYQSKLLSYAANYAAFVQDINGLVYAYKGLFGYYKGYFSVLPYYEKIKEYSSMEHRDMWEYELNFSEEEVRRMLLHLWELKEIYSFYYFIDENCSFNLMFLLEAARPSLHLTDKFRFWVIPIDTLRITKESGAVDNVQFRPSAGTRIRHLASLLNRLSQMMALDIVDQRLRPNEITDIEAAEKIKILDLAAEMVQYRYFKKRITKEEYQSQFLNILDARSREGILDEEYRIPVPIQPENGHNSGRFSLGFGFKEKESFGEFKFRPGEHELSDPDDGYVKGSEIVFFGTAVRYYSDDGIKLENLDLIDIVSVSPRDRFFRPISWKMKTGLTQKLFRDGEDHLVYQLNPGSGIAFENKLIGLFGFLAEANLSFSEHFKDGYAFGGGPSIYIIRPITDRWKANIYGRAIFYGLGDSHQEYKASVEQVFKLNRNNSFNLIVSKKNGYRIEQTELRLNWNVYF